MSKTPKVKIMNKPHFLIDFDIWPLLFSTKKAASWTLPALVPYTVCPMITWSLSMKMYLSLLIFTPKMFLISVNIYPWKCFTPVNIYPLNWPGRLMTWLALLHQPSVQAPPPTPPPPPFFLPPMLAVARLSDEVSLVMRSKIGNIHCLEIILPAGNSEQYNIRISLIWCLEYSELINLKSQVWNRIKYKIGKNTLSLKYFLRHF